MKGMVVDAGVFSDAMSKVSRVLKKCAISILEEIHVNVREGVCTLTATDLETWMTTCFPVQGDDMDFIFHKTKEVMKVFAHFNGELMFELRERSEKGKGGGKLLLYCGQRVAEYEVASGEDYPATVSVESDEAVQTNAAHLLERIERVRYATDKPDRNTKPFSTCVQFKGQRIFSLDGYRMACDTCKDVNFPVPFLAHGSSLAYLKVFGKNDISVRIGVQHILFTDGETSLYIRRYGVDTFNLDAAVPRLYQEVITVKTSDFIQELTYLKECAAGSSKPYVRFSDELLTMDTPNGRFRTRIFATGRGTLTLSFDLRHMLDALKQFKAVPEVTMKLSGVYSPIVIEAENRGDFALVLPVRLKGDMAA